MPKVKSAEEAKRMVCDAWRVGDPPINKASMTAHRQGPVWVVKYYDQLIEPSEHTIHIKAETGEWTRDE